MRECIDVMEQAFGDLQRGLLTQPLRTFWAPPGVKGGTTYGATDELGLAAVEDRVSVPDWHATILHLLGLHHDQLFVEINGLKEKLTGVAEARVVKGILA